MREANIKKMLFITCSIFSVLLIAFIITSFMYNKQEETQLSKFDANVVKEYLRKVKINFNISDYENSLYNYDKIDLLDDNVEEISKIEEKLKNMKKIDKTIFLDFYYSFKSIKDIAKEQKISEFSVKQRLYRIRNKIRKEGN